MVECYPQCNSQDDFGGDNEGQNGVGPYRANGSFWLAGTAGDSGCAETEGLPPRCFQMVNVFLYGGFRGLHDRLRPGRVSSDNEFAPKAADVAGFHLNPPLSTVLLSVGKPIMHGEDGGQAIAT
jgi:hypothetical protein